MIENTTHRIFFGALLLLVTAAFLWLIRGFLQPIFWAIALGIVFYPAHQKLLARLGEARQSLAASISVLVAVLVVVIPLAGVVTAVTTQAAGLYNRMRTGEIDISRAGSWAEERVPMVMEAADRLGIDLDRLQEQVSSSAVQVSQFMASQALQIGQNTLRVTVFFFLMLYLLFFFLRDWFEHCLLATSAKGTFSTGLPRSHGRRLRALWSLVSCKGRSVVLASRCWA